MEQDKFGISWGTTQMGGKKLIYRRHFYMHNRTTSKGVSYWKCVNKKCGGKINLDSTGAPTVTADHILGEMSAIE